MKTWNKKYEKLPVEEQTIILLEMALEYPGDLKVSPLAKLWWVNQGVCEILLQKINFGATEEEYNQVINEVLTELKNQL